MKEANDRYFVIYSAVGIVRRLIKSGRSDIEGTLNALADQVPAYRLQQQGMGVVVEPSIVIEGLEKAKVLRRVTATLTMRELEFKNPSDLVNPIIFTFSFETFGLLVLDVSLKDGTMLPEESYGPLTNSHAE